MLYILFKIQFMKTLAIIPAYQVGDHIKNVIERTKIHIEDIVVVDDGSNDGTGDIARNCGVTVIRHSHNRGKGAALKSGFQYAIEREFDMIITLDGDNQHDPEYIPAFLDRYGKIGADLIIGSRAGDKADMSFPRRCSNFLTSRILTFLLETGIEDSQSGFRLIKVSMLKNIRLRSDRYQLETEIIIKAAKAGRKIDFVPIKVYYGKKFPSSIKHLADTLRWILLVMEEI
jgi:glycosyltransferase involved in cell wall biosynthesis